MALEVNPLKGSPIYFIFLHGQTRPPHNENIARKGAFSYQHHRCVLVNNTHNKIQQQQHNIILIFYLDFRKAKRPMGSRNHKFNRVVIAVLQQRQRQQRTKKKYRK